jgi:hypothetical protein
LIRLLSLLFSLPLCAHAEYRVYQYMVGPKNKQFVVNDSGAKPQRSTLNPVAFIAYHGGNSAVDVTLLRSWMCPGYTGKKDFCPHPSEREVASE